MVEIGSSSEGTLHPLAFFCELNFKYVCIRFVAGGVGVVAAAVRLLGVCISKMPASDGETDDPGSADRRNFYRVEKWSRDGKLVGCCRSGRRHN
jgi:hypothetical protein